MKNIHVLPTGKPSRLYLGNNGNFVFGMMQTSIQSKNNDFTNQNIYITNYEGNIKKGEYAYITDNAICKCEGFPMTELNCLKKIILTTDQDLIADGVQQIDDEFLEWFIKNPSYGKVKLDSICKCISCGSSVKSSCDYAYKCNPQIFYKIIIPKEEQTKCYCGHTTYCDCGPKQETVEEAVERLYPTDYGVKSKDIINIIRQDTFINGTKWQQERSYSEEEVKKIIKLSCEQGMLIQRTINDKVKIPYTRIKDFTIKVFEQFKKL